MEQSVTPQMLINMRQELAEYGKLFSQSEGYDHKVWDQMSADFDANINLFMDANPEFCKVIEEFFKCGGTQQENVLRGIISEIQLRQASAQKQKVEQPAPGTTRIIV